MYSQLYSLEERWEAEALLCVCVRYCEPTKLLTLRSRPRMQKAEFDNMWHSSVH